MITIRYKKLASGKFSVYLDCYDETTKVRQYQFLKKYVVFDYSKVSKICSEDIATMQDVANIVANNYPQIQTPELETVHNIDTLVAFIEFQQKNGKLLYLKSFLKYLKNYIRTQKDPQIRDISDDWINRFMQYCREESSEKYTRSLIQHLLTVLSLAQKNGLQTINTTKPLTVLPLTVLEPKWLTDNEISLLLQKEISSKPQIKDAFMFSLYSGLRWQDIKALCWNQVTETVNGSETVNSLKSVNGLPMYSLTLSHIGTKTVYTIDLNPQASEILIKNSRNKQTQGLVFDTIPNMTNCFTKIRLWGYYAGLDRDISFSIARNTYKYQLIHKNESITQICKELGIKKNQKLKVLVQKIKNYDNTTV